MSKKSGKHRFHPIDECPAHLSWLRGDDSSDVPHCYMVSAASIVGKVLYITPGLKSGRHKSLRLESAGIFPRTSKLVNY